MTYNEADWNLLCDRSVRLASKTGQRVWIAYEEWAGDDCPWLVCESNGMLDTIRACDLLSYHDPQADTPFMVEYLYPLQEILSMVNGKPEEEDNG